MCKLKERIMLLCLIEETSESFQWIKLMSFIFKGEKFIRWTREGDREH
jgi:hypothetical protein